jgi:ligand-binding SRPBCC domain-containing protein
MTNLFIKRKRKIAVSLLLIWCFNAFAPSLSYALTSGPAQPEVQGFQQAGVADMVDLQNGDLKYNIPLLDIDGYPVNLSYQSGAGIDDEASWVGLGWSLNQGAINRQVRGLPDDFSGDELTTDHSVKPKVTVGGRLTGKFEFRGGAHAVGGASFGIFSDNYTGIGAEMGVNAGISFSMANDNYLTAGLGVGVLSNTQSGADISVSPYVSMSIKAKTDINLTVNSGLSGSFGYNSRSGLKALTLGQSFGASRSESTLVTRDAKPAQNSDANDSQGAAATSDLVTKTASSSYSVLGSTITYNTEPFMPSIQIPYVSEYTSFSFDVGGALGPAFTSIGGTGYQNKRYVKTPHMVKSGYGFLYAENGKTNKDAVMDFIREKDNPVIPELPNLALPVATPDIWSYTSQAGSGQFRLYRGGTGAFFDNQAEDESTVGTIGGDLGVGGWMHGGITKFNQTTHNITRKWTNNNNYLSVGDFQSPDYTNPAKQHVYFRQVGEKGLDDWQVNNLLAGSQPISVGINGTTANANFRVKGNNFGTAALNIGSPIQKILPRLNRTVISYLTAAEADKGALDKTIFTYPFKDISGYSVTPEPVTDPIQFPSRNSGNAKPHHISEITVTDDGGKRTVYGIPVYNTKQDEYTFAVGNTSRNGKGLVDVASDMPSPTANHYGVDNYYHKESKGPYATSFLMSAILSPDYVDRTGNGITDDDLGTAIKFNYSKLGSSYKWRTPFEGATPNKCLNADPDDDKASIVYGEKEVYYTQSIESKTEIAYFITENRTDALGVIDPISGGQDTGHPLKRLREIRLYSKADMTRPIKVVKFQYTYDLCQQTPNSVGNAGKLTLTKVWFEYGNSDKGKYHSYSFDYKKNTTKYSTNPAYGYMVTDRWGNYKPAAENGNGLDNEQYPYTNQDPSYTNDNVALWHLNKITLPTGGIINIAYEAKDYAYVQNKKAMVMTKMRSLIKSAVDTADNLNLPLNQARGLKINIGNNANDAPPPGVDQTAWFKNTFLNGSKYLYTKTYVQLSTPNYDPSSTKTPYYDMVPTYCEISNVFIKQGVAYIMFVPITESGVTTNPISISAWQRLKNEYPMYAYPGYNNRVKTANNSVIAAVSAIVSAAKNLSELSENFYEKANRKPYATNVDEGKSFVRIAKTNGFKLGGGARVKQIAMDDEWNALSGSGSHAETANYGQAYDYTTVENGKTISSGVATYEPAVGNDENPLKQPVFYIEHIKGAINNYFDLEEPFGESLYPSPAIGYGKVTVKDLDKNGAPTQKTGYTVNEFYTAKDFPVKVTVLPISSPNTAPNVSYYSLTRSSSDQQLCLSQGYSIELNDMHGKPKANHVFNEAGAELSSTTYYYGSQDNGGVMSLNNTLPVINSGSTAITQRTLGRDIDFFTDVREQESTNSGQAINLGVDVFPIPPWLPWFALPHKPVDDNNDHKLFRSVCAVKVIQTYGIITKVVKMQNGSTVTTENLAYDGLTGEALVTRTQNEFNKNIYSVNIPAYWAYNGMGGAYRNLGMVMSGFSTNANGEIGTFASNTQAGDEIIDVSSGNKYWVIENTAASGSGTSKKLIDRAGNMQTNYTAAGLVKIVRSGYRNILGASATSIVSLINPIGTDNNLKLLNNADLSSLRVINASANTYDENWAVVNNQCLTKTYTPSALTFDPSDLTENTSRDFSLSSTSPVDNGALFYIDPINTSPPQQIIHSSYWGLGDGTSGRRKIIGFWPTMAQTRLSSDLNYFGFDILVNFPETKDYWFAVSGYDRFSFQIDCNSFSSMGFVNYTIQNTILLKIPVSTGPHVVHFVFELGTFDVTKSAGLEIYNNTGDELINADVVGTGLNLLFSTKNYVGNPNIYSFLTDQMYYSTSSTRIFHFTKPGSNPPYYQFSTCAGPVPVTVPAILNPYISGYLGNWRPYQTQVFQQNRSYSFSSNLTKVGIDVKNAGYLGTFNSYWGFNSSSGTWQPTTNLSKWVTANTVTLYDKYGQQLENKDALGRYSAAKFDFNGELPSAVASNSRNREIYNATLEDNRFTPGTVNLPDSCNRREFVTANGSKLSTTAVNTIAHTGNYSAQLSLSGITLSTIVHNVEQKSTPYYLLDNLKQYTPTTTTGVYPNGFEPYPGKKYIFDIWVNDGLPNDKSINASLTLNNNDVPLTCKAVVEGWKLLEGVLDLTSYGAGSALNISVKAKATGTNVYIDDIRIHPFDAHMKTYAYDDKTMRLMAELDENAFATFYEYDDEGLLIRVKKETERGIKTLKETRSGYRKN